MFSEGKYKDYKVGSLEEFKNIPICADCLYKWSEEDEENFNYNMLVSDYDILIRSETGKFVKAFIENEGYDEFNLLINRLIEEFISKHDIKFKNSASNYKSSH